MKNKLYAAGGIFLKKDDLKTSFFLRSSIVDYSGHYAPVGGAFDNENDKNLIDTLKREIYEETSVDVNGFPIYFLGYYDNRNIIYYNFLIVVNKEPNFYLNDENDVYVWRDIDSPPRPLHPDCDEFLKNNKRIRNIISLI